MAGICNEQIRRSAKGGVQHHGVADGRGRENVARADTQLMQAQQGAGRAARGVEPDGLARGRERGMRQRQPQRLADHLRRGGGAQKLAAAAGRRAGAATHLGGVFERDLLLREARADGLHLGRVLALLGQQRDAAGNQHRGLRARAKPAPSSSRAVLCRMWPRPSRLCRWAASASGGEEPLPHRCDRAASPSCPWCPACGRRRDRCTPPRRAWRAAISARARLPPPAGPLPSGRCEIPARWLRRFPRASRHACSGSGIRDRAVASGPNPCRRFASGRRDFPRAP